VWRACCMNTSRFVCQMCRPGCDCNLEWSPHGSMWVCVRGHCLEVLQGMLVAVLSRVCAGLLLHPGLSTAEGTISHGGFTLLLAMGNEFERTFSHPAVMGMNPGPHILDKHCTTEPCVQPLYTFFVCGICTQGLPVARQMLYHLSHTPNPFWFSYFSNRVLLLFMSQLAGTMSLLLMLPSQLG
jgi:hypothetical protein